jgi:hypothetical protein
MVSSKAVLLLLNTLFFLLGFGILSIGLWSQYDANFSALWKSLEIAKLIDAKSLNGASLLLIISGVSSVIISFIGLYGTLRKDKCFLTTYCLLICIILILEIAAASVFISYKNQAPEQLKKGLNETVNLINEDQDKKALALMNVIQPLFKCCGCEGKEDYRNLTQQATCETAESSETKRVYYDTGCYQAITGYINTHLPALIGASIALVLFQLFCLIISIKTCHSIKHDEYSTI